MPLIKVKSKAQITLPVKVRQALGIEEGDYLEAKVEGNKVILIPQVLITKFPPVTLSEQGEEMLKEAQEEVRAGKVKEHESAESLINELHNETEQE